MRLTKMMIIVIGLNIFGIAQADNAPTTPTAPAATATPATTPASAPANGASTDATLTEKPEEKIIYCPTTDAMLKKGLFWGAPGGWRSYAQSFVVEIGKFVGAQWAGINVGKMLCIYKAKTDLDFPVILQNDTLTLMPSSQKLPDSEAFNHWGKYDNGYVNCNSVDVKDCPFERKPTKVDIEQVYKDIDFFKDKKNNGTPPQTAP
jgi:hypothetical protein